MQDKTIGVPRWDVVVLIREAGRTTLYFNAGKCLFRFLQIIDVLVPGDLPRTINDITSVEQPWTYPFSSFNQATLNEAVSIIERRATKNQIKPWL